MGRYHAALPRRPSATRPLSLPPHRTHLRHGLTRLWAGPRWLLRWALALLILFEEWGWEPLARLFGLLSHLPPVRWLEARIAGLPPYGALAVFLLPSLLLVPVKLLALMLIAHGHALSGLLVIVAAKLVGTALLARLFALTRDSLLRLAWFERLYGRWHHFKETLLATVRASPAWQAARRLKRRLALWLRRWRRG